jgi:cob(I)alamin adenosyltransferase
MTESPLSESERHRRRMQRKKAVVDQKIAQATEDRGIVVLLTGNGKGKSSSGFGTVIRCLGHGYKAAVVQFIKGASECGERNFLARYCPALEFHVMGTGFTWETQDKEVDRAAAAAVWREAQRLLADETIRVLLLDELTYVLKYGYLDSAMVIDCIRRRPHQQSVIVTGRGAPPALKELADTLSDIEDVKHAFRAGIKAQRGVEW